MRDIYLFRLYFDISQYSKREQRELRYYIVNDSAVYILWKEYP